MQNVTGLAALPAHETASRIASGVLSSQEHVAACLDRIDALEDEIGAFAHLDRAHAMAQARACDARQAAGLPLGPLHGVAVAIKDIIDTADFPTECGTSVLQGRRPLRDAFCVQRLRAAGAVIIGKTVTTECAYFHPGKTRNPRDYGRTPGGSSSGSAAAVAAGMVPLALGSQTNGSIIRPASYCGVFAMKPSHGLVSRAGVLMLSRKLDHIGPFARSLEDLALALDVLAVHDSEDPDSVGAEGVDFLKTLREGAAAPRFAFVRTPVWSKADPATQDAITSFARRLGDRCVAVDLPDSFAAAWDAQRAIMAADMAHYLDFMIAPKIETGSASDVLRQFMEEGRHVPAARYRAALETARDLGRAMQDIFATYDAVIAPATTGVAPKGLHATGDPAFCTLWTLLGVPALSLPLMQGEDSFPLGLQLVGAKGEDARLLRHARWLVQKCAAEDEPPRR